MVIGEDGGIRGEGDPDRRVTDFDIEMTTCLIM